MPVDEQTELKVH